MYKIKLAKSFKKEKIVVGLEIWEVLEYRRPSGILRIYWHAL